MKLFIFAGLTILLCACSFPLSAQDLALAIAPAPYAPLDLESSIVSASALSPAERKDLIKEFKGVIYMALQNSSYTSWPGRSMSDCLSGTKQNPTPTWSEQCELLTPQTRALYSFYGGQPESSSLKRMDVQFRVSGREVLEDLKRPIDGWLGRSRPINTGQGWRWDTGDARAQLTLDETNPAKGICFTWSRAPFPQP